MIPMVSLKPHLSSRPSLATPAQAPLLLETFLDLSAFPTIAWFPGTPSSPFQPRCRPLLLTPSWLCWAGAFPRLFPVPCLW